MDKLQIRFLRNNHPLKSLSERSTRRGTSLFHCTPFQHWSCVQSIHRARHKLPTAVPAAQGPPSWIRCGGHLATAQEDLPDEQTPPTQKESRGQVPWWTPYCPRCSPNRTASPTSGNRSQLCNELVEPWQISDLLNELTNTHLFRGGCVKGVSHPYKQVKRRRGWVYKAPLSSVQAETESSHWLMCQAHICYL